MNFYSHVAVASLFSVAPRLALGSMLPDLASLIGARPPRTECPDILRGYALHHTTDRIFHSVGSFRRLERAESQMLQDLGLYRGAALGAAHVGLELVLDDALAEDEPTRELFRRTIASATPHALGRTLNWVSVDQATRFETLRQRVWTLTLDRRPLDAATLTERLCRTLARRPRLAIRADDRALVQRWAMGLQSRSESIWPDVMGSVVSALGGANWHLHPSLSRSLRFRRASGDQV